MSDKKSASEASDNHSSPQGGQKDTRDLHDLKQVQKTGMEEKAKEVADLPDKVKGTARTIRPQKR